MKKFQLVRWIVGLSVILLTTFVWGQPASEAPRVTQAQACNHWSQPIGITIRQENRLSVGRLVQIAAEDLPSGIATSMVQSREFTVPRLVTTAQGR